MPALSFREWVRTGAPTHRSPSSFSSSSIAYPRDLIVFSSALNRAVLVIVFDVIAFRPDVRTIAFTSASGSSDSMALPTAVQYAGARLPTVQAVRTLRCDSTLST